MKLRSGFVKSLEMGSKDNDTDPILDKDKREEECEMKPSEKAAPFQPRRNSKEYNPEAIFSGRDYEEWRARLTTALAKEGVRRVLRDSNEEKQFRQLSAADREEKMEEFVDRQEIAKSVLYERLDNVQLRKIRNCVTVRDMVEKLDKEYRVNSKVGLITARDNFQTLRYDGRGDLRKYLDNFESNALKFLEAGGELNDDNKVQQLSLSVPTEYDSVLDWYEMQDKKKQTYENYRRKLLEKDDRLKRDPRKERKESGRTNTEDKPSRKPFVVYESPPECYRCNKMGHIGRNCPDFGDRREQKEENPEKKKENDTAPAADEKLKGADWSKFRSNKRPTPAHQI